MKEHSKLIGGFLGFLLAGPLGLLLGTFIGHFFDKTRRFSRNNPWVENPNTYGNTKVDRHHAAPLELKTAYEVLGVASDVKQTEIKQAYRRFISHYHPDRLSQKGLSPTKLKTAMDKSYRVKQAYELICKANNNLS